MAYFVVTEACERLAALLDRQAGRTHYGYCTTMAERSVGFLGWTEEGACELINDGADSYFIRNGMIEIMRIHYAVKQRPSGSASRRAEP